MSKIAVALVHHPILNRKGESATTAVTPIDVHDFARTCAFYDVSPVYIVHPADGMFDLVADITSYWKQGQGGDRNPGRRQVLESVEMTRSLEDLLDGEEWQVWYTSAMPPSDDVLNVEKLAEIDGNHLIVFGTGWGLDVENMPKPNGWLSAIEGMGMVRHLSVRAALSIYLDRLRK
ncbi:MAG: RNA methyltransferase [Mariprofundaceae bacterium]